MNAEPVTVYLGLGSNTGNRQEKLERALDLLSPRLKVLAVSPVYDTEPVGDIDQPRFLNLVCQVQTRLAPEDLLALVKSIEMKMGRSSGTSGAPRPIDIDILLYGDQVVNLLGLVIPHSRLAERAFVLIPLCDIAPDVVHPVYGKAVSELLRGVNGVPGVLRWID